MYINEQRGSDCCELINTRSYPYFFFLFFKLMIFVFKTGHVPECSDAQMGMKNHFFPVNLGL